MVDNLLFRGLSDQSALGEAVDKGRQITHLFSGMGLGVGGALEGVGNGWQITQTCFVKEGQLSDVQGLGGIRALEGVGNGWQITQTCLVKEQQLSNVRGLGGGCTLEGIRNGQ